MRYLLDTNAWIIYLKDPDSGVRKRLSAVSPQDIVTCSIVVSELLHGAEKYGNRMKRLKTVRLCWPRFSVCLSMRSTPPIMPASDMTWRFAAKSLVHMIYPTLRAIRSQCRLSSTRGPSREIRTPAPAHPAWSAESSRSTGHGRAG